MKTVVKLTGIYNYEGENLMENFSILGDSCGSYNITRFSEYYNLDLKEPKTDISKYCTNSMLFDLYIEKLIYYHNNDNKKNRKKAKRDARALFDYIIFEIIGDSMCYREIDYKIVEY